jgi:RHS repeat-associated protein
VPSDLNYDGVIDGTDEAIYWEHYDAIGTTWHAGDFRGEGRLSFTARELGGTTPGVSPALPQTGFTAAGQLDIDNRFGYAGYIWDQHLGIYHVRHRAYDPFAGRWLQPDPLALMGPELLLALTSSDGSNLYAYVGNNPNGFVDPYGLWGEQTANDLYNNGSVWGRAAGAAVGIAGGHLEGAGLAEAIVPIRPDSEPTGDIEGAAGRGGHIEADQFNPPAIGGERPRGTACRGGRVVHDQAGCAESGGGTDRDRPKRRVEDRGGTQRVALEDRGLVRR